jgi:IS1 family transposase
MVSMNKLSTAERVRVVAALVEGCSIRATVRMTGVAKNTVAKLLVDLGTACAAYHDEHVRNVKASKIQVDEIWTFTYAKERNVPADKRGQFGYGDTWTWTAIDADSKLVVSYLVGLRDAGYAHVFMNDVASRLANRVQLTSDGHNAYRDAVDDALWSDGIDYAQLVKVYGKPLGMKSRSDVPDQCIGAIKTPRVGNPDPAHISTSFSERQNLTMRMHMRRFTRLTNAFSKKVENHAHNVALHFMHYNFCRVHQTLRVAPAMEAGLADHVWEIEELVELLNSVTAIPTRLRYTDFAPEPCINGRYLMPFRSCIPGVADVMRGNRGDGAGPTQG